MEMHGRYRGDIGEIQGRCRRSTRPLLRTASLGARAAAAAAGSVRSNGCGCAAAKVRARISRESSAACADAGEIWGDVGRCGEVWRDMGRWWEMW